MLSMKTGLMCACVLVCVRWQKCVENVCAYWSYWSELLIGIFNSAWRCERLD